jgi:cell division protein FtsX
MYGGGEIIPQSTLDAATATVVVVSFITSCLLITVLYNCYRLFRQREDNLIRVALLHATPESSPV